MEYLSLPQATKILPTTGSGKPLSTQNLFRWCVKGCRGVRLRHARFGRRIVTTEEWLNEFSTKLAEAWNEAPTQKATLPKSGTTTRKRTPKQREQAAAAAEARLRAEGILQ